MPELIFVGTGDAFGSGGRRNSAILVRSGPRSLLLDCGATTLLGLKELGIDPLEIDVIAISHYHGDHAAGIPFLMLDYLYEHPRDKPLEIVGPPGIEDRVIQLNRSFEYEGNGNGRYPVRYGEFICGKEFVLEGFKVMPFAASHHPDTLPHMMRVEMEGRSLFFSGDTGWYEAFPENVGDVDLLISECTLFEEGFEYHLSHECLEHERGRFRCGQILLTHLGSEVLDNLGRVRFDTSHDGLRLSL